VSGGQTGVQQPIVQSPLDPVVRWLTLLSAMVLVGGLVVDTLVWRPVLTGKDTPAAQRELRRRMTARVRRLWWASAILFALASVAWLLVQSSVVGASPTALLGSTDWGRLWLWRAALFVALCGVFAMEYGQRASKRGGGEEAPFLSLAIGPGLLLTFSLASHGAAVPGLEAPGVISDYAHLLASALWVGGLVLLAAALPLVLGTLEGKDLRETLARMLPRFSFLAALSVAVLTVTGLYSAWLQVTVFPALLAPFGLALLAKVAVIGGVLGIAAFNLLWLSPRLHRQDGAGRLLRRTVTAEALLVAVVILLVGLMTSMEPARQAAPRLGIVSMTPAFAERVDGLNVAVTVGPGTVGSNTIRVTLTDRQDGR
jgi:copper transport protein